MTKNSMSQAMENSRSSDRNSPWRIMPGGRGDGRKMRTAFSPKVRWQKCLLHTPINWGDSVYMPWKVPYSSSSSNFCPQNKMKADGTTISSKFKIMHDQEPGYPYVVNTEIKYECAWAGESFDYAHEAGKDSYFFTTNLNNFTITCVEGANREG